MCWVEWVGEEDTGDADRANELMNRGTVAGSNREKLGAGGNKIAAQS